MKNTTATAYISFPAISVVSVDSVSRILSRPSDRSEMLSDFWIFLSQNLIYNIQVHSFARTH